MIAVLTNEGTREGLLDLFAAHRGRMRMSAGTYLESSIVADSRKSVDVRSLDDLIETFQIEIVPFTPQQAQVARAAYQRFGKGSGHPAGLNMGDCFSYALAATLAEPLLCVGQDFPATDLAVVSLSG